MQWTVVLALIFALLVGVFAVQNNIPVDLKFFTWQFNTSLAVIVLGGVALGALMIGILGLIVQIKSKIQIRALKGKIKVLERQLKGREVSIQQLNGQMNDRNVDLARFEGAQEEILAQEALQAEKVDEDSEE
ncbi:MAG: LapA family protein [Halanaerobiales bacterium]|nr:LapA family protein [Halanaerobiales bacterium]